MTTLLLDTHAVHWWAAEPERVSDAAARAIAAADELAVASITWWELAWLADHGRIGTRIPTAAWLAGLAREVRTVPITPSIAAGASALPSAFPKDPADRLIWATATELGLRLVTKDGRLHAHDRGGTIVLW